MLHRVGVSSVVARCWLLSALVSLGLIQGCAGPEGAFMGTLDRPDQAREATREPVAQGRERSKPVEAAPTAHGGGFTSPQGISISSSPLRYFEPSVEGRDLDYWVVGEGSKTVLILGCKHGNERSSGELAFRFLEWALDHPEQLRDRRLVFAPMVNPDGFARNTRENARLVDLNRNFPSKNWKSTRDIRGWHHRPGPHPRSEPETRFLLYLLSRYPIDRVISIHGAASCVNWDGPGESLARAMARECGLPPKATIGYPTPGSFGAYLGMDLSVPTITLELTENRSIGKPFETYRRTLMTALYHPDPTPSFSAN